MDEVVEQGESRGASDVPCGRCGFRCSRYLPYDCASRFHEEATPVSVPIQRLGWRSAITPVLFGIGLVVNLAGLAVVLGRDDQPARAASLVFLGANLLWLVAEAPVSLGKPGAPPREVATLICYGLTRFATVAAALFPL